MTADPSSQDAPAPVAALVLGAAVWPGGRPSPSLQRRAEHAARLYEEGHVTRIVGCGGIGRHGPSEASLIAEICAAAGVPAGAIALEERSTTTIENICFALPVLARIGTSRVALVSDRYHLPRAGLIARRFGLHLVPAPAPSEGPQGRKLTKALLRETAACLWLLPRLPFLRPPPVSPPGDG